MHQRITKSCVLLAAALIGSAGDARAIDCQSEKGAGHPWAWRQIDGKRCWYKGKAGMDKKHLRWAETATTPAAAKRTPPVMSKEPAERERLLHSYWPALPQVDFFGDRFEAVRGRRQ